MATQALTLSDAIDAEPVNLTVDDSPFVGLVAGTAYTVQILGGPLHISEQASAPSRDDPGLVINPSSDPTNFLEVVPDSATPPWVWAGYGGGTVSLRISQA